MIVATVVGNVGNDGELKYLQDGTPVLNFQIACKVGRSKDDKPEWVKLAMFGRRAEAVAPFARKGVHVTATGSAEIERFEKRDGSAGSAMVVRVDQIDFVGGRRSDDRPHDDRQRDREPPRREERREPPRRDDWDDRAARRDDRPADRPAGRRANF